MARWIAFLLLLVSSSASWAGDGICRYLVTVHGDTPPEVLKNPLLYESDELMHALPLGSITKKDADLAVRVLRSEANQLIDLLLSDPDAPTFGNTMDGIAIALYPVERLKEVLTLLQIVKSSGWIDAAVEDVSELLSDLEFKIFSSSHFRARLEQVLANAAKDGLDAAQVRLMNQTILAFDDYGAQLSDEDQGRLKKLADRLEKLELKYDNRLYEAQDKHLLFRGEAKPSPKNAVASNHYYSSQASLNAGGAYDTRKIVLQIADARRDYAKIRGHASYADDVFRYGIFRKPSEVWEQLEVLSAKFKPLATAEWTELERFAGSQLDPYDFPYWSQEYLKKNLGYDPQVLQQYFPLRSVVDSAIFVASELFDIRLFEHKWIPTWDTKVIVLQVIDANKNNLGLIYLDLNSRSGKHTDSPQVREFVAPHAVYGRRPHAAVILDFDPPHNGIPTLLTPQDVLRFYHEFGHALHSVLSQVSHPAQSAVQVSLDFAELQSQLFERFAFAPEVLDRFAHHYLTGTPLSDQLAATMRRGENAFSAVRTMQQIQETALDLALHDGVMPLPAQPEQLLVWERKVMAPYVFGPIPSAPVLTRFQHVISGGYDARYYSYLWTEVLAEEAFRPFQKHGYLNREWGMRLRKWIYEPGDSMDPNEAFRNYLDGLE
jgi:peptidyl-dipeptidase Dcp